MHENVLPVNSPEDLCKTGHLLYVGQQVMSQILLELWKHREEIEIGVFDFTPEQRLATTSDGLDDDTVSCIEYHVTDLSIARPALKQLQLAFDFRKKTPSASGTWVLLVDGLARENWELFKDYLKDGKLARMYVIAATSDVLTPGDPLHDVFDTVIALPESRERPLLP